MNQNMSLHYSENAGSGTMSEKIFFKFSSFIQSELGIKMPPEKKVMLQSRLSKRLRRLGLKSFDEYYDLVFSQEGRENELQNMIDVVTTNKTDFFREPKHFHYLVKHALPEFLDKGGRKLMVWSAGCSTGAEPYTIAMILRDFSLKSPGFNFSILATDLSSHVLKEARMGIYNESDISPISMEMRRRYLLRSRNQDEGLVRIVPDLRSRVEFRKLNFMDENYYIRMSIDMIFCRNVIIYFSRSTQETVLNRICQHLKTDGYLYVGHSETLNGLNVPLVQVQPNIYKKC